MTWMVIALIALTVGAASAPWRRPRPRGQPLIVAAEATPDLVVTLTQLAGLLRAGIPLPDALRHLDDRQHWFSRAAAAIELGQPVPRPPTPELNRLAITLTVVSGSGGPAADALEAAADALADERDAEAAVESALAAPTATARLLTALPVVGLGLGYLLGADPLAVLVAPGLGWGCLVVGVAGNLLGWLWSRRLIAAVSRKP